MWNTEFESRSSEDPSPAFEMERKERIARLMELVQELTPNQREVVRLRFQNFHSYQEISDITKLSVGNVGFILNAAMRSLREKMERDDREEKNYLSHEICVGFGPDQRWSLPCHSPLFLCNASAKSISPITF